MTNRRRPAGARLLRLYPAHWRARYESELLAVLEQAHLGIRGRLDLVRGAIDARLHSPSRLPAGAALLAGGLWAYAGAMILAQPAPPDWPGYLQDTILFPIVAVAAGALAIVGCWARRSDSVGRAGGAVVAVAVAGHLAWLIALIVALAGLSYGWQTAAAQGVGVLGTVLVGLVLLRSGDTWVGGLLVLAPTPMLFAWPVAWLGFGLAWTLVGVLLLTRLDSGALPGDGQRSV